MPRRKTVQPPPLETFTLEDGTVVEIRDETCQIRGRGLHKRDEFEKNRDKILKKVVDDYFAFDQSVPNSNRHVYSPPKRKIHDYLLNGSAFARRCQEWGYASEDGSDDSALRKNMYKEILHHVRVLKAALEEKNKGTSSAQ